jgi:hypothetical protein
MDEDVTSMSRGQLIEEVRKLRGCVRYRQSLDEQARNAPLLFAYYQGLIGAPFPVTAFGAAFYIPTVLVPLLLITHGLVFRMLLTRAS